MVLGFKERFADGEATNFVPKIQDWIKTHTIREDKNGRYKVGQLLHLATGVRTKNYRQFGWAIVTKIQKVKIMPEAQTILINVVHDVWIMTDDERIAKKDGFRTVERFWEWFNVKDYGEKWEGKLIHFEYLFDANCPASAAQKAAKIWRLENIK